jgi:outer membrane protein OmpA-like peptidoglycan-associated protein
MNVGLLGEYDMMSGLRTALRVGYSTLGARLTAREQSISTTITTPTGTEQARIDHTITAHISNVYVEPSAVIELLSGVHLMPSLRLSMRVKNSFDQIEQLADDQAGVFAGGLRTRNEYTNRDIPSSPFLYPMAALALRVDIPVAKHNTVLLSPELRISTMLQRISSEIQWRVSTVELGASLRVNPVEPPIMRYDTILHRDTVLDKSYDITAIQIEKLRDSVITTEEESGNNVVTQITERWEWYKKTLPEKRPYFLEAAMKLKAVDASGQEKDIFTVRIEEVVALTIQPLLPYVFFDEGSDFIPERYKRLDEAGSSRFSVNDVRKLSALELYRQVLNIVGRRMTENPQAVLTLTGCNQDMGSEKSNTTLSKSRAERVRDYFQSVWKIDASRLKVKAQNLPNVPSSAKSQDGIDENRRVEMSSNDPDIFKNVVLLDTILRAESVNALRFYPTVRTSLGLKEWSVRSELNDTVRIALQGNTMPEERLEWDVNRDLARAPRDVQSVRIRFDVKDKADSVRSIAQSFPVELITRQDREKINNKYIDKYSLILYDFGTYTHTAAHQSMLQYIREHSKPTSTFSINGHTDRSGSAEYNMMLSTKRAEYTAKALNVPLANAKGFGKEQELYDNNYPEGRMYNRTVNIVVETPVE